MKLAIVGSGVAGLTAARMLHADHDITVFEADSHVGGHVHTHAVEVDGRTWHVDTGFIVYNLRTYPNFIRMIESLGVATQPTPMGFSVCDERTGLQWCGSGLGGVFAQRRNLFKPRFIGMVRDILRFNREAPSLLDAADDGPTLGEWLETEGYGDAFVEHYIVPMGAAIWSSPPDRMRAFPARYFVEFFRNHGLLTVNDQPPWRVVSGGSARYVEAMTRPFAQRIRVDSPIERIERDARGVALHLRGGSVEEFDGVVIACHSDQALALLDAPTLAEREVLGSIPYQRNSVLLHTDDSLLPSNSRARAAWNYRIAADDPRQVTVTYDMNLLQGLDAPVRFCVTLNQAHRVAPDRVLRTLEYAHPVFTDHTLAAHARRAEVSGVHRTAYCGAYWRYGFHEDGVMSGLWAAEDVGRWQ